MKNKITQIYDKFDILQEREKYMVAGLIFVLIFIIWLTQISDESTQQNKNNINNIKSQQQKNNSLEIEITAYTDRRLNDPNIIFKKQKKDYFAKIDLIDVQLKTKMKGLITPKMMTLMLRDIFINNESLTLLSLENLKTESIYDLNKEFLTTKNDLINNPSTEQTIRTSDDSGLHNTEKAVLYRHPVKIVFSGSYINTLKYLEKIESMPWDIYWDTVKFDVEKYPVSTIIITVFTLSLKKGWIGV